MEKEDLRNIKTLRALTKAMFALLNRQKFMKITVRDICDEAMISRATFYTHFIDKYDFLKSWLIYLLPDSIGTAVSYDQKEDTINNFIYQNKTLIRNIICDANEETLNTIYETMLSVLNLRIESSSNGKTTPQFAVLSNIYVGGLIHYILWLVKNNFPSNVQPMNRYLFDISEMVRNWELGLCEINTLHLNPDKEKQKE